MNKINKAPLMAFVLGLGLMLTTVGMSSFKGETRLVPNYSRNPVTGVWSPLTASPGTGEGEYSCLNSPPRETYCTGFFSSTPAINATPDSEGTFGDFVIND